MQPRRGLCLVVDVLSPDTAVSRVDAYLAAASELADVVFARVLSGVGGSPDVAVVAARDPAAVPRLTEASPLPAPGRVVCGVDPSVAPEPGADAPGGYVELVLARDQRRVPFDDPAVVGVFRDFFTRYLPMLGSRHLRCDVLWQEDDRERRGVRAAGGFIAFRAADDAEAQWWAEGNPWRRVAPGYLLRLPPGTIRPQRPPGMRCRDR